MATLAHLAYHCTYNLTGEHAIATDLSGGGITAHLNNGTVRLCTLADVTLCGPAEVPTATQRANQADAWQQAIQAEAAKAQAAKPALWERYESDRRGLVRNPPYPDGRAVE